MTPEIVSGDVRESNHAHKNEVPTKRGWGVPYTPKPKKIGTQTTQATQPWRTAGTTLYIFSFQRLCGAERLNSRGLVTSHGESSASTYRA